MDRKIFQNFFRIFIIDSHLVIKSELQLLLNNNMTPTMYGVLKINGVRSYFRVILLVNVRTNIYIIQDSISSSFFLLNLGCFACFCPCCMNCKLAKHLGESSAIGCCPGSLSYLRTKLRTARRVQVRRDTFFKNAKRIFVELD